MTVPQQPPEPEIPSPEEPGIEIPEEEPTPEQPLEFPETDEPDIRPPGPGDEPPPGDSSLDPSSAWSHDRGK